MSGLDGARGPLMSYLAEHGTSTDLADSDHEVGIRLPAREIMI